MSDFLYINFYRFVSLPDYKELRGKLLDFCNAQELKGSILLAEEGINAMLTGTRINLEAFKSFIAQDARFQNLLFKEAPAEGHAFKRMKVRLKKEIVRMKQPDIVGAFRPGAYLSPEKWDEVITAPDVVVVDTRNDFEVQKGSFKGAVNPQTKSFGEFPEWVDKNLDPRKHKKVAMFCTGGIRCEKSTAYLKSQGFEEVYHLEGGIITYLEKTQNRAGLWHGECFVFDERESA